MPKIIPPEKKKAILAEYKRTMNGLLTAKHHGVGNKTVMNYVHAAGLPVKMGKRRWKIEADPT